MAGELSHGLPWLSTASNQIIDSTTGEVLRLRGVNRSGLEYSEPDEDGFASAAGLSRHEIRHLCRDWRARVIRLPFNQDFALRGRGGRTAEDYLRDLDRVIDWAASYGAYTILDLQWLDADTPFGPPAQRQFVPPLPNHASPGMWSVLARRYREEPAVLFDILNEPHDRMADDPFPLPHHAGGFYPAGHRRVSTVEWLPWARLLVQAIRAEHPRSLIFVGGTNWGYDLRGIPMDDIPNLVYSTHIYANKGTTRRQWQDAFGRIALTKPVFAGEWGPMSDGELDWGRRLLDYLDELQMGWCAWSWVDQPRLMTRYAPTRFGDLALARMR